MPGKCAIDVIKNTSPRHKGFAGTAFFTRASKEDHRAWQLILKQILPYSHGGAQSADTQQVMSTTMTGTALDHWLFTATFAS